jgi:hypothetical protein
MTTTHLHRWAICAIGSVVEHRAGTAGTVSEAWTAALARGHAALLAGDVGTLAVAIEGDGEGRGDGRPRARRGGRLDAGAMTATLVEIYQSVTARVVTDLLVGSGRTS